MYQIICPVLEGIRATEGLDASDGAGTGTEIDEVRRGLRSHLVAVRWVRRKRRRYSAFRSARSVAGGIATRPMGRRVLYDRRLGRVSARRAPVDEVMRGARAVRHPLLGLHRQALPREAGRRSRLHAQLQLGAADLAGAWAQAGRRRAAARTGASGNAPRPARHDAASGRLVGMSGFPAGWWDLIVTMDDATSEIYSAFFVAEEGTMSSFLASPRGDPASAGCSARSMPTAPATTGTRRKRAARWTRTIRPRSDAP